MKSILVVFTFIFSLTATAQVDFPYKRPELLVGKTVLILPIDKYSSVQEYREFYAEKNMSKYYKGKLQAPKAALEGRKFIVTAVEPKAVNKGYENYWITLKDVATGETVYNLYNKNSQSHLEYYFKVDGGLTLPSDFYCDYIEEMKMPDGNSRYTLNQLVFEVVRSGTNLKPAYSISLQLFEDATQQTGPLTITGEDGSKLTLNGAGIYTVKGISYVGGGITAKELEALSKFKPISFEYGGKSQVLFDGDVLQKGSACLLTK